jgi:uncharacterized membrane protein
VTELVYLLRNGNLSHREEGIDMSKADFFLQLRDRLRGLPYEEQQDIVRVYEDLFRQAEENGKSERDIIESLGYVPVPAPYPTYPPQAADPYGKPVRSNNNGVRVIVASIALGLFNLIFILAPFIAAAAMLFSLSLISFLFMFSFIWIVLGTGAPVSMTMLMVEIFIGLTLTGAGVLLGIAMWKSSRGFIRLVKRYIRLNLKLIKGE